MAELSGMKILIFVGDDYEDLELWYPKLRLEEAGAKVTLAGLAGDTRYVSKHGYPVTSDVSVAEVNGNQFDGVVIPGGWMPDKLRRDAKVLSLTRHFAENGKLVASICHGGWINASADICQGVRMTSTPGIKDDLVHAGGEWIDAEVIVDRHYISSRRPADLPAFGAAIVEFLQGQDG